MAKAGPLTQRGLIVVERANMVIDADRQRLTQALMNLVRNAIQHTNSGLPIEIGSRYEEGEVRLWVKDSGDGISAEERDRIFERFARGTIGRRRTEGAGLGLSIVKVIAEAHAGRVLLESAEGAGARFTISIPAEPPYEAAEEEEFWA